MNQKQEVDQLFSMSQEQSNKLNAQGKEMDKIKETVDEIRDYMVGSPSTGKKGVLTGISEDVKLLKRVVLKDPDTGEDGILRELKDLLKSYEQMVTEYRIDKIKREEQYKINQEKNKLQKKAILVSGIAGGTGVGVSIPWLDKIILWLDKIHF